MKELAETLLWNVGLGLVALNAFQKVFTDSS